MVISQHTYPHIMYKNMYMKQNCFVRVLCQTMLLCIICKMYCITDKIKQSMEFINNKIHFSKLLTAHIYIRLPAYIIYIYTLYKYKTLQSAEST